MTATMTPVRLAPERLGEAAAVMGRAVVDDPLCVYFLPDAQQRRSGVPMMMEMFLRIGLAHGEVWVTPPPIRGSLAGSLPRVSQLQKRIATRLVGATSGPRGAARQWTASRRLLAIGMAPWARLPRSRIGISPGSASSRDSKDKASAAPSCQMTTRGDAEGMACRLFTFAPRNVPIYEHLGSHVSLDAILPSSGLRLWVMAHSPRVQSR